MEHVVTRSLSAVELKTGNAARVGVSRPSPFRRERCGRWRVEIRVLAGRLSYADNMSVDRNELHECRGTTSFVGPGTA